MKFNFYVEFPPEPRIYDRNSLLETRSIFQIFRALYEIGDNMWSMTL